MSDCEKLSGQAWPLAQLKDPLLARSRPTARPFVVLPHFALRLSIVAVPVTPAVVAAMTANPQTLVARFRRPRGTHVRVSYTRIRSMRESCCTEEQRERQRECADYGLESVFHLGTPSSLDNLVVLVLLRGGLNRSAFNPRESQLPACMKGKERTAPMSDG
jgi:hypothetical protein